MCQAVDGKKRCEVESLYESVPLVNRYWIFKFQVFSTFGTESRVKLQFKVTFLVMAILIVIGIISGGILLYFQRKASVQQFEHMATALAGAVQSSLEHSMLIGERMMTQEALVDIGEEEIVREVVLLSPNGTITASSEISDIGKVMDRAEIHQALQSGEVSAWINKQDDVGELLVITPIRNKPECKTCHSPETNVLGAIQVSLDTTSLDNQTRQQTIFFGAFGGLTLLIIGGGLAIAVRRTVLAPLFRLAASAQRLSQGDYAARAISDNNDEIGLLAQTFNEMAESVEQRSQELESSRQELARWNVDLEEKIQERTNQLATLNAIITTVSQSLNLEWILNATLTKILILMDIESGAVHLIDKKSEQLNIMVHRGLSPEYFQKITRLKVGEHIAGRVVQSGELIVVNEVTNNPEAITMMGEKGKFRAYISLPLKSKNKVLGTLSLASYLPNKFKPEAVSLLRAMGDAIGIAVENAIAAKRLEEANKLREQLLGKLLSAQEEERQRIARELHDEASQSLAAVVLQLEDIADTLPARYRDTKRRLDILREQAIQTLEGIRNLALELRPSALDDLGLSKAIDWYAKDYLAKRGINAKIEVIGPKNKLPSNIETVLFRITQEALTNVVKHADASQVTVRLQLNNSKARMQIEDNGKGFDVEAALTGAAGRQNLGLHGMLERATLLSGTLNIQSQPGQGTCLSVEIPLVEGAVYNE